LSLSEIQNNETTTPEEEVSLVSALLPAFIVWLKLIFYFLVLPYKIWKATTLRLSDLAGKTLINDTEEYPMYTFTKISYDGIIFIFGFLTVLASVIGLFAMGIEGVFIGFVYYFLILFISLLKEIITMSLGVIKRLESIDRNTQK
jgi:hypothetical protein